MSEQQADVRVLDPVDFHGQALVVVERDREPYVAMKPIVEGMGLAWQPQHRKLTEDGARWGITMMVMPSQGGEQIAVCLPLRKLGGWLMTLQTSRMDAVVASRVLTYQQECDDALWAYWSEGVARNPRAEPKTPGELFLESAQRFLDNERRMMALETEQRVLAQQVGSLMQSRAEGEALLRALPAPTVEAREVPVRARINQAVQAYIHAHGLRDQAAGEVWRRLYREFLAAYDVDLVQRAKNRCVQGRRVGALDIAEELDAGKRPGTMAELYAVAVRILGHPTRALMLVAPDALEG